MSVESDISGDGGAGGVATAPLPQSGATNTPAPSPKPPDSPAATPPKKRGTRKRARAVSAVEAENTLPEGGKCVDPDCPEHGENRAPKKCVETGKDIWPRMSEKEAFQFAMTSLTTMNKALSAVAGGVEISPPTAQDAKEVQTPLAVVFHRYFGSWSRYSMEFALLMALSAYAMEKVAEAKRKQKAEKAKDKTTDTRIEVTKTKVPQGEAGLPL